MKARVFYAGLLYGEYEIASLSTTFQSLKGLPDGAYIKLPMMYFSYEWYMADFTPLAEEHVPKELLVMNLLMG